MIDMPNLDGKVMGVSPGSLSACQVNTLVIDSDGPVVLLVPEQAIAATPTSTIYRFQNTTYLLLGEDASFNLLIAPTATNVSMSFYGHGNFTFRLEVTSGSDPLISGADIYDMMEEVTHDIGGYNGRYVSEGSPQLERAALHFESLFDSYGLDAEVQRYWNGIIYDYSELHSQQDTLTTMRDYMGGREGLEAGFEVTAWMSLGSLLLLDHDQGDPSN